LINRFTLPPPFNDDGFNSFRFGYAQYNLDLDVEHYTTVLDELLQETKLDLKIDETQTVTYHDPCFLGRWNKVYDAPRRIIESIEGVTLTEMSRSHEESFCCGGGGGHMFFEVEEGERISKLRMDESQEMGAETLLVACPYCSTMLGTEARARPHPQQPADYQRKRRSLALSTVRPPTPLLFKAVNTRNNTTPGTNNKASLLNASKKRADSF